MSIALWYTSIDVVYGSAITYIYLLSWSWCFNFNL